MKVLFVCRANIFRSQIAEALFRQICKEHEVASAGTVAESRGQKLGKCSDPVARDVIEVMGEEGIDLEDNDVTLLNEEMVDWADKVVCMAEKRTIPEYLSESGKMEFWNVADATAESDHEFYVESRERIRKLIEGLAKEIC